MSKVVRAAAIAVVAAMAGCSGGGGRAGAARAAGPTTTSIAQTTTSIAPTTTTLSQEDQVKAAWNGYWTMVVRLAGAPNPDDPELQQRAVDPLLSFLRDDFGSQAAKGDRVFIPAGARYEHRYLNASISEATAIVIGCQLDDSVTIGPSGETVDGAVLTKHLRGTFRMQGGKWIATEMDVTDSTPGLVGCA